jgi:hypothetical protein
MATKEPIGKDGILLSLLEKARKPIVSTILAVSEYLPRTPSGDRLYALVQFARAHRRLPRHHLLFSDQLYKLKTSGEIRSPLRVFVTDKELAKLFIKAKVGSAHCVPTLAILRTAAEVDAFQFPDQCCIKPTHASGLVIFRTSGETLDREEIKRWLKVNYYDSSREQNYRDLEPKIIVEPLLFGVVGPTDYKMFCYKGRVKLIEVHVNYFTSHAASMYDRSWSLQDYSNSSRALPAQVRRPPNLEAMIEIAENLSSDFSIIRIDLYSDGESIFVGELTNCSGNANEPFVPPAGELLASRILFS